MIKYHLSDITSDLTSSTAWHIPHILISPTNSKLMCLCWVHKDGVQSHFFITFLHNHQFTVTQWGKKKSIDKVYDKESWIVYKQTFIDSGWEPEFYSISCQNVEHGITYLAGRSRRRSIPNTTASSPADRKEQGESGSRASWNEMTTHEMMRETVIHLCGDFMAQTHSLCALPLYVVLPALCSCSAAWPTVLPLWSDRHVHTWPRWSLHCEAGTLPTWNEFNYTSFCFYCIQRMKNKLQNNDIIRNQ